MHTLGRIDLSRTTSWQLPEIEQREVNLLTVGLSYNTVGAVLMCRQRRLFRSSVVWKGVQGGGRYQRSESRERQTQRSEGCLWHRQTKSLAKVVVVVVVKKNNDTTSNCKV